MRCLGFPSSRQSTRRAAAPAVRAAAALVPVTEVRLPFLATAEIPTPGAASSGLISPERV